MIAPVESSSEFRRRLTQWNLRTRSARWIRRGRVPGSSGYSAARWAAIERGLSQRPNEGYGYHDAGLDERVVEYPWAIHRLKERWHPDTPILDAGSAFESSAHSRVLQARETPTDLHRDSAPRRPCGSLGRRAL